MPIDTQKIMSVWL